MTGPRGRSCTLSIPSQSNRNGPPRFRDEVQVFVLGRLECHEAHRMNWPKVKGRTSTSLI